MTNTNLIFYTAGCYGTFFEWILGYLAGDLDQLPFEKTGSSHGYHGNMLFPPERLFEYINNNESARFSRSHPGNFKERLKNAGMENDLFWRQHNFLHMLEEDTDFLNTHFTNIVCLVRDQKARLWIDNNILDKCSIETKALPNLAKMGYTKEKLGWLLSKDPIDRLRNLIAEEIRQPNPVFTKENLQGWNKDSLDDFDLWELRELLSLYWFTISDAEFEGWENFKQNCKHPIITVEPFRQLDTFMSTVLEICKHFDVTAQQDRFKKLEEIYPIWRDKQIHIDKDQRCEQIANSVTNGEDIDWSKDKLSILDEAWIQKLLRDNGNELRCYNLNDFPTTTKELRDVTQ